MGRLMDSIGETVRGHIAKAKLSPLEDQIRQYILREFARNGKAPTAGEIATGLQLSSADTINQTIEKLHQADILLSTGGGIVLAYPFSAAATRHRVVFADGRQIYALCATDALGTHSMLDKDITILSRCPECEGEISIVVKDGQITTRRPEGTIEFVSDRESCSCTTAESHCPFINFFCSREHLEEWREKNPEHKQGEIYSLSQALGHGKAIFGDFLRQR